MTCFRFSEFKNTYDFGLMILLLLIALCFFHEYQHKSQFQGRHNIKTSWEYAEDLNNVAIPQNTKSLSWKQSKHQCIDAHLNTPILWLRSTLPQHLEPSHIIIRSYSAPFEVFVNNALIYQFHEILNSQNRPFYGFASHRIPILPSYSDQIITFRLNVQSFSKPGFCGPTAIQLEEDRFAIPNSHQDGIENILTAFLGGLFGCLALSVLLVAPKNQRYFYGSFAGLMFSISCWIYSCVSGPLQKLPLNIDPLVWSHLDLMGLYLTPPFLIMFYCQVFERHSTTRMSQWLIRPLTFLYRLYFLHSAVIFILSSLGISQINSTLQFFDISALSMFFLINSNIIAVIVKNRLSIMEWIKKSDHNEINQIKYFSVGFFSFTATGIHDVFVGLQSSSISEDKHWLYIGTFSLILSLFLLLVNELTKTIRETQHHKTIEETFDRSQHDSKTPVTRMVELASSLYTLIPKGEPSHHELIQFKDICLERLPIAYNIALQAERNLSNTIKNRKDLETFETPNFCSVSIIELIHEQMRQSLCGYKFTRLCFHYDFQHKSKIHCDSKQISRVFSNLLSNAAKFARGNPPTIVFKTWEKDDFVTISMINTGVPIAASECERIFDKFYTIKGSDPTVKDGHGIGLTIVKKFIDANYGSVKCKPVKHFGTEFLITLKSAHLPDKIETSHLFQSAGEIPQVASIILSKNAPLSEEESLLQKRIKSLLSDGKFLFKVCIIDDEYLIRESLISYIATSDLTQLVTVVGMEDPIEGIEYVFDNDPDLILVDLVFGKESKAGFFILDKLKEYTRPYKVLYTNNYIKNNEFKSYHADSVLEKPLWRLDFFRLILKVLERNPHVH